MLEQSQAPCSFLVYIWGFPRMRSSVFSRSPNYKDHSVLGPILGYAILGKLHVDLKGLLKV